MLEKIAGVPRRKLGRRIGQLELRYMTELDKALLALLGLLSGIDDEQA